jgi:hypothetical protein
MTGGWRKLQNEKLHNLYSSPSIIRIFKSRNMRWTKNVARRGENGEYIQDLVGKPVGRRPLRRHRRRWEDNNNKIDLIEIG